MTLPVRLDDEQLQSEAARFERAKKLEGATRRIAAACQDRIVTELELRGVREWDGKDTHVTVVQGEKATLDEAGLYGALNASQRRGCYRAELDLNALPAQVRDELATHLTEAQRRAITRRVLDTAQLDAWVSAGRIRAAVVAAFTAVKKSAAFIRVSHGPRR